MMTAYEKKHIWMQYFFLSGPLGKQAVETVDET